MAGIPFLDYVLTWLRSEGVENVVLCVGFKRTKIKRYVGTGRKWGLRVTYSVEQKLLGTGGAVKKAGNLIPGNKMLVVNGDTLVKVDLKNLVEFHEARGGAASLVVAKVRDAARYGVLELDERGRILEFLQKAQANGKSLYAGIRPINAGVYIFDRKALGGVSARKPASLERDVFPQLVAAGKIYGFVTDGYFIDIGIPEDFRRAQRELREW